METEKTISCMCVNCGGEAEMTIKCEEMVPAPAKPQVPPQVKLVKRTVVCTRCGNEADMIVDYEEA